MTAGGLISTVVYGVLGIALCVAGYFVFDKVAGLSLKRELVEDQNVAVGIMLAGVFIGIAIGMVTALRQYSGFDYSITFVAFLFFSLPVFWIAQLLKSYLAIGFNY